MVSFFLAGPRQEAHVRFSSFAPKSGQAAFHPILIVKVAEARSPQKRNDCLSATCWRQVRCQSCDITAHRPAQLDQRDERQVVFAALDPTDIAAVKPGFVRQSLLRETQFA